MVRGKKVREKGKIQFSRYFQKLAEGDRVAIIEEQAVSSNTPKRMKGRTGIVKGKRGSCYVVQLNDQKKEKTFIVKPIHLKKINA